MKAVESMFEMFHEPEAAKLICRYGEVDYIREKWPEEVKLYKTFLDEEYGIPADRIVHCKECVYRGNEKCLCHPFYPTDDFYCARGDMT